MSDEVTDGANEVKKLVDDSAKSAEETSAATEEQLATS